MLTLSSRACHPSQLAIAWRTVLPMRADNRVRLSEALEQEGIRESEVKDQEDFLLVLCALALW